MPADFPNIELGDLMAGDVYDGNGLSVAKVNGSWVIYYFIGGDDLPMPGDPDFGAHEKIVLNQEEMDELAGYFANYYAEDKLT